MITTQTTVTVSVTCDQPGCTEPRIQTVTETGLRQILEGMGWWIGADGRTFCPTHTAALQAAGKLPARST